MKYSTPKLTIPSFTFRLEVIVGIILLYLMISCLVFGSCLKVSFGSLVREGFNYCYDMTGSNVDKTYSTQSIQVERPFPSIILRME